MVLDDDLLRLLRESGNQLDQLFGIGGYDLTTSGRGATLTTPAAEICFGYDYRDGWISASIRPLHAPVEPMQPRPLHFWLRFIGHDEHPTVFHERLGEKHLRDVLDRLAPIVPLLFDSDTLRDGAQFVNGYYTAASDWLRKRGHWERNS